MKKIIKDFSNISPTESKFFDSVGEIFEFINLKYIDKSLNSLSYLKEIEDDLKRLNFLKIFNSSNGTNYESFFLLCDEKGQLNISMGMPIKYFYGNANKIIN